MTSNTRNVFRFSMSLMVFGILAAPWARAEVTTCEATEEELKSEETKTPVVGLSAYKLADGNVATARADDYIKAAKECTKATNIAQKACYENCSSALLEARVKAAATGGTIADKGASANIAATKAAEALKQEAAGFRGFLADCAPKQTKCSTTCDEALKALEKLRLSVENVNCSKELDDASRAACGIAKTNAQNGLKPLIAAAKKTTDIKAVAGKKQECTGKLAENKKKAETAAGGLDKAVASALANALVNAAVAALTPKPNAPAATAAAAGIDCAGKDAASEQCICQNNPRACGGQLAQVSQVGVNAGADKPPIGNSGTPTASTNPGGSRDSGLDSTGSGSSGTAGVGGTGGLPSGGDSPSNRVLPASSDQRRMNADIYNGSGGDSGGGMMDDPAAAEEKGLKLGSNGRGFVGGNGRREVDLGLTSSGGRSNWEKVSVRYLENSLTLVRDPAAMPK